MVLWCNVGVAATTTVDCDARDEACNWRTYKAIDKKYTKVWGIILNGREKGVFNFMAGAASIKDTLNQFHKFNACKNVVCKVTHIGVREISNKEQIEIAKQFYPQGTISKYFLKKKKPETDKQESTKTQQKAAKSELLIGDLDVPITKAEFETEVIKPNKEYRQSCEADVTIEGYDLVIKANSYIDVTGKKQTLVNEIIFDIGEDGKIITKYKQKIKSDGTLSKVKASSDYIPGSVEYSKKEIKQVKKTFKSMAQFFDKRVLNYGEKATPGINRTDETKEFIKILKLMESLFRDEDPKEVKEFINMAKKDMEFKMVKEYLGTTELYGEKFYAITFSFIFCI